MSPRIGLDLGTLLDAATELADQGGLESVTLASLAGKLNVRSPSLYNHVNGLPELRRQLALRGLALFNGQLAKQLAGLYGDEALRRFCYAYIAFARENPGLYESVQLVGEPEDAELKAGKEELVSRAAETVGAYGLEGEAAIHAVRGLRSLLHGFASLERQGAFRMKVGLDESLRLMIDTFLFGMKAMRESGD
ncbi:TetR/AcrR family transcriptional regulator [Cohnella fermenti]|uniref:TetR/AcrR family transcriptional regulator n=1 Tax=Cohnella fermenti TaxID=2565925 RepID=A0A4S4BUM0_9BACL|nr:TetR/AcrR family transcriptional regulator [Cohnella fermenti]THF78806.1 TetR/AcrR family transcriptional regulator [Cohnella fermenti]